MSRPQGRSLTRRVIVYSSLWTIAALVLLGWLLFGQFRAGAERNFNDLQKAQLFALVGAVNLAENGEIAGIPNLGDSNFLEPFSGWYWQVSKLNGTPASVVKSQSLLDRRLERASLSQIPLDSEFTRRYTDLGPAGEEIRVLEAEIDLGAATIAVFQVAGNEEEFRQTLRDFASRTAILLSLFGLGMVAINAIAIRFGLRPLDRIRKALTDIREGRADSLDGDFPRELSPMVSEMNRLVDNNRMVVDRARTQVGNLAHSLKTPISVLLNEAEAGGNVRSTIVRAQTESMRAQVQHYLDRARIAAQQGSVAFRTEAVPVLERLLGVMRKLNPDLRISFDANAESPVFAGEKEDFEEIVGNVVENACKWAKSEIRVSLTRGAGTEPMLFLTIEDDGPGIPEKDRPLALKRGQRLDETVPGTGLGLSIVADAVEAYGGAIQLLDSPLGGLKVEIRLPAV